MFALSRQLGSLTVENVFAGSLIGGLAISLLLYLSVFRMPLRVRGPRFRFRLRRIAAKTDAEHMPSFLPASVGLGITFFGLFGLIGRVLIGLSPVVSLALAGVCAAGLFAWLIHASQRFLANTGNPMEGSSIVGRVVRVSLAIPVGGVGAIAYSSDGKRHTMPARSESPLGVGTRVLVTDLSRRVAVVEDLDFWLSEEEAK
jgi:membrane protein implicated in regulation of membrane protease activity